jgi:outer membrane immunogenic protein
MRVFATAAAVFLAGTLAASAADLSYKDTGGASVSHGGWSGFYVGVNGGYGASSDLTFGKSDAESGLTGTSTMAPDGLLGGIGVGFNVQPNGGSFVLGAEADIQLSDISGSGAISVVNGAGTDITDNLGVAGKASSKVDWFGTVRARAGLLVSPGVLVYGTGGLAYGGISNSASATYGEDGTASLSGGGVHYGWVAGTGMEWKIDPKWSLKGEYLYIDLGSDNLSGLVETTPVITNSQGNVINVFRVGVNYKLN